MEGALAKQVRYGRSCQKCRAYFVTEQEEAHLCPWCVKTETGRFPLEAYGLEPQPDRISGVHVRN